MPQAAAKKALSRLTAKLWLVYGSTEAGTVSFSLSPDHARPEMVGTLVPTAELQIVDPAGQALPHGAVGEVRTRGSRCVTSYLDEPEVSRACIKDGWFLPGDLGTLSETGDLSIVGRAGDIMNLGGQKVALNVFEDALSACSGVKELAVFSVPDELGRNRCGLPLLRLRSLCRMNCCGSLGSGFRSTGRLMLFGLMRCLVMQWRRCSVMCCVTLLRRPWRKRWRISRGEILGRLVAINLWSL